jgi:hypothetical protein
MLDTANKARLESVSAQHASLWLDMKPTRNPHNILDPITYQIATKLHLAVPLALLNGMKNINIVIIHLIP